MSESLLDVVRKVLEKNMIGKVSMADQAARWNDVPFEERVRYASFLLRRELDPAAFSDVRFAIEGGGPLDPDATITVSLLPISPVEVVHVNFTLTPLVPTQADAETPTDAALLPGIEQQLHRRQEAGDG